MLGLPSLVHLQHPQLPHRVIEGLGAELIIITVQVIAVVPEEGKGVLGANDRRESTVKVAPSDTTLLRKQLPEL